MVRTGPDLPRLVRELSVGVHAKEITVGRGPASVLVGDPVVGRQLGADESLAGDVDKVRVVVQRPDDMSGQFRCFGCFQDVSELVRIAGDDLADSLREQ